MLKHEQAKRRELSRGNTEGLVRILATGEVCVVLASRAWLTGQASDSQNPQATSGTDQALPVGLVIVTTLAPGKGCVVQVFCA